MSIFRIIFGYCYMCRRYFKYPKTHRLNTAYADKDSNYQYSCMDCYGMAIDYYIERWQDYYNGVL